MTTAAPIKPKRFYASTYGPRPSYLFKCCMGNPQLRWILRVGYVQACLVTPWHVAGYLYGDTKKPRLSPRPWCVMVNAQITSVGRPCLQHANGHRRMNWGIGCQAVCLLNNGNNGAFHLIRRWFAWPASSYLRNY